MQSLTKVSLFKLPIILALSYWLMGLVYIIVMNIIHSNDFIHIIEYVFNSLVNTLYYGIPKYLLLIFISTVALNRCNVHIMTEKNILLIVVLALILTVITQLVSIFVTSPLFNILLAYSNNAYYHDHNLYFVLFRITISLIYYFIIGLISYLGILSMKDVFERDLESVAITKENSTKVHLVLFIILFNFVLLFLSIPLLTYLDYSMYYYDENKFRLIAYVFSIIISIVILYFSIRKVFSCSFSTLQTGRLIKSTLFSTLFIFLFNAIVGSIVIFIVVLLAFSRNGDSAAILILIFGGIFQFVMTYVIVRAVTKRYFSISHNESTI